MYVQTAIAAAGFAFAFCVLRSSVGVAATSLRSYRLRKHDQAEVVCVGEKQSEVHKQRIWHQKNHQLWNKAGKNERMDMLTEWVCPLIRKLGWHGELQNYSRSDPARITRKQ